VVSKNGTFRRKSSRYTKQNNEINIYFILIDFCKMIVNSMSKANIEDLCKNLKFSGAHVPYQPGSTSGGSSGKCGR
jgi:hypothetical protein